MEAERNVPAAVVTLARPGASDGPARRRVGRAGVPLGRHGGRAHLRGGPAPPLLAAALPRRLNRFVHEMHPGTRMDSRFSSYVTKIEGGLERDVHITMNEPLRHRGYTFYQSGWGPQDAPPGTPLFSTFCVVRNPSDRVPILACVVIAVGLADPLRPPARAPHPQRGRSALRPGRSPREAVPLRPARGTRPGLVAAARAARSSCCSLAASRRGAAARRPSGRAHAPPWPPDVPRAGRRPCPLQEGGRVKPLDTYAGYSLLRLNHKRSCQDADGERQAPPGVDARRPLPPRARAPRTLLPGRGRAGARRRRPRARREEEPRPLHLRRARARSASA